MGVYIKGMEMPVIELEWTIRCGSDGKWYAIDTNAETSDGEWHEIVPVPAHVERSCRLIDIDLLKTLLCVMDEDYDYPCISPHYLEQQLDMLLLDDAPTIIKAEEGE